MIKRGNELMNKTAKTPLWGKWLIIFASLVLCVGMGTTGALAATSYSNNFTMMAPSTATEPLEGGMNDVVFEWDGTQRQSVAKKNQVSNCKFSTATRFDGFTWSTHDVVLYGPGTYTIYTACPAGSPGCGLVKPSFPPLTFTVGDDELGVHYQFNWSVNTDIDMINVFKRNAAFGPSLMCTNNPDKTSCNRATSCESQPAGFPSCPSPDTPRSQVWDLMSKDVERDGINGLPFVDGPFIGFSGNMNVMNPFPGGIPPHVWPDNALINFGGSSGDRVLTIKNNGDTSLDITTVENPTLPFSVVGNTCSGASLAAGGVQQCTVTIHFERPSTGSEWSTSLLIHSNDLENISRITLFAGNDNPLPFDLVSPADGATNVDPKSELTWNIATDPNGDKISYHVYICTDSKFGSSDCAPATVASRDNKGMFFAGGAGLLMIGMTFVGGLRGRKRIVLLLVLAVLLVTGGGALLSCKTTDNGATAPPPPAGQISYIAPNLSSNTTYYWRVAADDGHPPNNLTYSPPTPTGQPVVSRSFTTK